MKLLRPILGGLGFMVGEALLEGIAVVAMMLRYPPHQNASGEKYFFEFHWHLWRTLFISLLTFFVGFYFQYRRDHHSSHNG